MKRKSKFALLGIALLLVTPTPAQSIILYTTGMFEDENIFGERITSSEESPVVEDRVLIFDSATSTLLTASDTSTVTAVISETSTATTDTPTASTPEPTPTATPSPTLRPTPTYTPTPESVLNPPSSPLNGQGESSPTPTPTSTPTPEPTPTPTVTSTPTPTPEPVFVPQVIAPQITAPSARGSACPTDGGVVAGGVGDADAGCVGGKSWNYVVESISGDALCRTEYTYNGGTQTSRNLGCTVSYTKP